MARRIICKYLALAAIVASTTSCGTVFRENQASTYLVMVNLRGASGQTTSPTFKDVVLSDVRTGGSIFNDIGEVIFRIAVKDIGLEETPPAPTSNNDITINRYRVVYRRGDGHNTPGVDVPYPFDGAMTGTVPGGQQRTFNFELVRHIAKAESPLAQLASPNTTVISTIADVTFYGRDQAGNTLSVSGSITIDFGDFADPS
jgi:hypothetical protein